MEQYSRLPVAGNFRITCEFGREGNWKAGFHTGVDIVNDDKIIYSPTFGKVHNIGFDASYGNFVVIADDTPDDVHYHWLCHLNRIANISIGEDVTPETKIGIMGDTGRATGVHLHYEIRNNLNRYGVVDNPCLYMGIPNQVGNYNEEDFKDVVHTTDVYTLARNTNLRNAPTVNSSEKTLYLENTTLYVLEKDAAENDGYTWDKVRIRVTGQEGYMINQNYKGE